MVQCIISSTICKVDAVGVTVMKPRLLSVGTALGPLADLPFSEVNFVSSWCFSIFVFSKLSFVSWFLISICFFFLKSTFSASFSASLEIYCAAHETSQQLLTVREASRKTFSGLFHKRGRPPRPQIVMLHLQFINIQTSQQLFVDRSIYKRQVCVIFTGCSYNCTPFRHGKHKLGL